MPDPGACYDKEQIYCFFFATKAKDINVSFVNSWLFIFCCEGKRYQFIIREFVAIFFDAKAKDINASFVNSWLFFLMRRQKISILHS